MIYKVTAILLLSLFVFANANSQQVYFPKNIPTDSATLSQRMYVLARNVTKILKITPKDKRDGEYYGSLFALQTMMYNYAGSLKSLDSVRTFITKIGLSAEEARGYLNIYDDYNNIKILQQAGDTRSVQELFSWSLPIVLGSFKGNAFNLATEPYSSTEAGIEAEWQATLTKARVRKNDSIYIDSAIMFAQAYLKHFVYKPVLTIGKRATIAANNANFIIQDSTLITMRDGVKLSAVIVREKKVTTPQPVVLMSSIYSSDDETIAAKGIASRGYVGVILNTRGKYVSDAAIEPWEHDAQDTYDAIDWISKQPWCNGKVGMYGPSYLGFTQWAATKKMHPALKTIVPQVAAAPGVDFPSQKGIHLNYALRWARYVTNNKLTDAEEFSDLNHWNKLFTKWYKLGAAFNKLDSVNGHTNAVFQKWLKHPSYDAYWQNMIPYRQDFSKINIPVLTITGYFDDEQFGALYYYKQHHLWNAAANHYLVIGPYDHFGAQGQPSAIVNGYHIDAAAGINIDQLVFQWLDYVLKGGPKPALLKDTVNYEIMGANQWGHASSLKKLSSHTLNFYLSANKQGKLNQLSREKTEGYVNQTIDFKSREIATGSGEVKYYRDSIATKNIPTYISEPLQNDIVVTGAFTGNLIASINKKDMDLLVWVGVKTPYGKYFSLSGVWQRASYAKDISKRQLLTPGLKESIPVTGEFISQKIVKGSRIIVQVSVIKTPGLEINYGTGKDVATETIADAKEPLKIKWFANSVIQLPVAN